ncbi:hypothetical protein SprV_0401735300 [Sparganum proliferum]
MALAAWWLVLKDSYLVVLKPQKLVNEEEKAGQSKTPNRTGSQDTVSTTADVENGQMTHRQERRWHRGRRWRYCKVVLVDQFFNYFTKPSSIGPVFHVGNMHGEMNIRTTHESTHGEWIDALARVCSRTAARDYLMPNPHGSFAPVRTDGTLMLCIDGAAYMDAVADAIAQAKYEIFITDWWLSPEIFLKRPEGTDKWRLDMLLKRKAESGVRVCIMIYREVALAISINSRYASKHMSSLHRNIHVLRHPDHLRESVLFWSHHEKLVVIDQSIAFMGGIDLCYGRWDRTDHPLLDLDRASNTYERKQVKSVKVADVASKSMMMALMPLAGTPPEQRATNVVKTSRADVLITDMPPTPEPPSQRSVQTGTSFDQPISPAPRVSETEQTKISFQSLVNSARMAVSWKRQTSIPVGDTDKGGIQLLSDGQLAYRKSTRRRGQLQREQTVDMYVPNVGHLAVPVDVPETQTEEPVKLRRRHSISARLSDRRKRRVRSYSVAGCTNIEMSAEQSTASNAVGVPPTEVPVTAPRKSRPSRAENVERLFGNMGNRLQGFFERIGSTRRRSPMPKPPSDSDDSDDLEYDNLGFHGRRESRAPHRKHSRRHTGDARALDEFYGSDEEGESELSALSRRFIFVGKDYGNWLLKDAFELDRPAEDMVDRTNIPRMPWHDCGCAVSGKIASDFARHFIQRWNVTRIRKMKRRRKRKLQHLPVPPILLPCPPVEPWVTNQLTTVGGKRRAFPCRMQALRSAGRWSLIAVSNAKGAAAPNNLDLTPEYTECSILQAYVEAIRNAEHFIYIENQFYISWLEAESLHVDEETEYAMLDTIQGTAGMRRQACVVQNPITQAIYERILKAHREQKPFRVYIILPLLPGFSGDPGNRQTGASIHAVLHYTRNSLFKGPTALIPRLQLFVSRPYDYISVCGLRTYDQWPDGQLTTELIYVHCKLMVVDDRKLIIGSANINDRSMLGYRDSELALVAEDTAECGSLKEGTFAGTRVLVGSLARRFRKSLMAEHLGVLSAEARANMDWDYALLDDPVCDQFFHHVWKKTANQNSEIFEKVFSCLPSDNLHTFEEVREARTVEPMYMGPEASKAAEMLKEVRGHLVHYPEDFLLDEEISPPVGSKENVIPEIIWT